MKLNFKICTMKKRKLKISKQLEESFKDSELATGTESNEEIGVGGIEGDEEVEEEWEEALFNP